MGCVPIEKGGGDFAEGRLVADDQLTNIFSNAVEGVTGP